MGCVRNIVNFYYDGIIIQLLILSLRRIAVSETQWLQKRLRFFKITSTTYSPPQGFTLRGRERLHVGCRVRPCFKSAKTAAFANTTNTTSTNTTYSLVDTMLLNS